LGSGWAFLLGVGRDHWGTFCLSIFIFFLSTSGLSETAWTPSSNKCLGIEEGGEFGYGLDLTFSSGTFSFWGGF